MEGGSGHLGRQMCKVKKVCTCIVRFQFISRSELITKQDLY